MATRTAHPVLRHLRKAVLLPQAAGLTDGQLLGQFLEQRDEVAFEALVRRHGPMVLGVCRRVLRNHHDAEDAFQATFLVLVRKASSVVPRQLVANWLYGVAYQTALKARAAAGKRRAKERQVTEMPEPEAGPHDLWRELRPLLDLELSRLPDKYRAPIVLCDLQGKTRREAAQQLGWPEGTLSGRLARARALLAKRLARHGLTTAGGALAAVLSARAAACVPAPLVGFTVKAAHLVAAGQAAAHVVSPAVAALTEGVLQGMLLNKLKALLALVSAVALTCVVFAAGQTEGPATKGQAAPPKAAAGAQRLEALWSDLASTDEARASRALLGFAATPRETTAFFKDRLKPLKASPDHIKKLIADLDHEQFNRRESASRELEYLGQLARPHLEKHLEGAVSLETKTRIRKLLDEQSAARARGAMPPPILQGQSVSVGNINGVIQITIDGKPLDLASLARPLPPPRPNTHWLRAVRAVTVLELFGTPEARSVLEALAGGEPEAPPTREARTALERLAGPKQP
jgi:RNA polymerase sigma factor (sigma-70 family)